MTDFHKALADAYDATDAVHEQRLTPEDRRRLRHFERWAATCSRDELERLLPEYERKRAFHSAAWLILHTELTEHWSSD